MGTKMASAYANIFMGRFEGQLLRSVSLKPFSWFRFIDDVDMKWTHGPENLEIFLQEANRFHPTKDSRLRYPMKSMFFQTQSPGLWAIICGPVHKTHRHASIPSTLKLPPFNTAAEMFRIVWLSVSGEYALILIHLSLGQQSYRINFEDEVTTYNQYPQRPRTPGHKEEMTCFATSPNQNHQAH